MGGKIKEEEKIERAIRALLRLPENRRCINCNSLGPQYVCTTFWTFICTTCSGVHREFTHRVKSVSMARFSAEEVSALQAAGNERARQIYFKAWDPQNYTLPDGSNLHRLRDFIKHVYVDRIYTGERGQSLPTVRARMKEDQFGSRKALAYANESRRSSFDNKNKVRYSGRFSPSMKTYQGSFQGYNEERNLSRGQENSRTGSFRKGTTRFEVVDNRFREDAYGSGKRSESQKCSSPRMHNDAVGGNVLSSKVGERSNAKAGKDVNAPANNQKISLFGNVIEQKVNLGSLIDFSEDFKPSGPSNETSSKETKQIAPSANTMECLLFGWSDTDIAPSTSSAQNMPVLANQISSTDAGAKYVSIQPCSSVGTDASDVRCDTGERAFDGLQLGIVEQHDASTSFAFDSSLNSQGINDLFRNSRGQPSHVLMCNEITSITEAEQPSWAISNSQAVDNGLGVQSNDERKELPADLFICSYTPSTTAPGWQTSQWHSMGFYQPYHVHLLSIPMLSNAVRSKNPFDDYSSEPCLAQPTAFSSMASLQEAVPAMPDPRRLLPISSSMVPQQYSYYTSMAPSASMEEAAHNVMPPSRSKEISAMEGDIFGSLKETSRPTGGFSVAAHQNISPTTGGNPFW